MSGRGRATRGRGRLPPGQEGPGAQSQQVAEMATSRPGTQSKPQVQPPSMPSTEAQAKGRSRGRARGPSVVQGIAPATQPATGKPPLMLGVPRHLQTTEETAQAVAAAKPRPVLPSEAKAKELQTAQHRTGAGRAAFRGGAATAGEVSAETGRLSEQMSKMEITAAHKREHFRLLRVLRYLDYDDVDTHPTISKIGSGGTPIPLITNYFRFQQNPDYHLNQYHVDFNPQVERREERIKLLDDHTKTVGRERAFDGMILFTTHRLEKTPLELCSKRENGEIVTIIIRETGEVPKTSPTFIQVVNIQMRKALALLKLRQVGHHFFDPSKPVDVPNQSLSVMPGFITAVKYHENGLLLGIDVAHKVLRHETALDVLRRVHEQHRSVNDSMKEDARKLLLGSTILTRYNNRTYRVDDIDFDITPRSTFKKDGKDVSYIEYYRQAYNITIRDHGQPLVVSRPKAKDIRGGRTEMIYLVPELCAMTGLTDDQRGQGQLMRAMSDATRVNPDRRIERMLTFQNQLTTNPRTKQLLEEWEIIPQRELLVTQARVMARQELTMRDPKNPNQLRTLDFKSWRPDWSGPMKSLHMSLSVPLRNWIVCFAKGNNKDAFEIVEFIRKDAPGLGMPVAEPRMVVVERDSPDNFKNTISKAINPDVQLVMAVVPNIKKDRYDAIKKLCCVEKPCPSQVVCARLKPNVRRSACTKIAIQINCKLGGVPWMAGMPLSDTMYIGIDTYHDSAHKMKSALAFVATMDRHCTQFFCDCSIQGMSGEELANTLAPLVKIATMKYMEKNQGRKPLKYIIYRDGVGDGMLRMVNNYEKKQIVDAIMEVYKGEEAAKRPLVFFIVVKKRILTRLFTQDKKNPPPGTVVDRDVTTQFWFDFFLISQSVGQGTVNPVHYNCIEMPRVKELCLTPDQLQILTYRMCHLYYNWAGTIRVPMLCMYAHKLAFLVGQSLHCPPNADLCNRLFFL